MGCTVSCCRPKSRPNIKLAVLGLDNAGKSTVVNNITGDRHRMVTPTVGFSNVQVDSGHVKLTVYDLGGGASIRQYWPNYFHELHGLVFVIDASADDRISDASTALGSVIQNPLIIGKPILILANKQDLPGALSIDEISQRLDLSPIPSDHYRVLSCVAYAKPDSDTSPSPASALPDQQIVLGVDWLKSCILQEFDSLHQRTEIDSRQWIETETRKKTEQMERVVAMRAEREMAASKTANDDKKPMQIDDNDGALPGQVSAAGHPVGSENTLNPVDHG